MNLRGDNMISIKRSNRSIILNLLHSYGQLSRKRLAEKMELTSAAITFITREMVAEGLLCEGGEQITEGAAGRREIPLMISYDSFVALGVTINVGVAILSATTLSGKSIFSESVSFNANTPATKTVQTLSQKLLSIVAKYELKREQIVGLGVSIRGIVDVYNAVSVRSFGAFNEKNIPLKSQFEKETGFPTAMDNNVRSMFRTHIYFTGESYASQLFIRCERGIGGAVSANGRIISGNQGKCAEVGHTPIVEKNGKLCACGKNGCLETISTRPAILDDVSAIYSIEETPILYKATGGHIENLNIEAVIQAAEAGDLATDSIVQNATSKLSFILKAITYTLDPCGILVCGSIFEHEYYLESLRKHFAIGTETDSTTFIRKSNLNLELEEKASCVIAIESFFENGGMMPQNTSQ